MYPSLGTPCLGLGARFSLGFKAYIYGLGLVRYY